MLGGEALEDSIAMGVAVTLVSMTTTPAPPS
jgi:hypothetical protein